MLNDLYKRSRAFGKPQPGWNAQLKGNKQMKNGKLNCSSQIKGVLEDNPYIKKMSLKQGLRYKCPPNHYKGLMIVSPGNDYHFARQDDRMCKIYRYMNKNNIQLSGSVQNIAKTFVDVAHVTIPEVFKLVYKHTSHVFGDDHISDLKVLNKWSKLWSHKPGSTNVTDKDASGNYIVNPLKANWNYGRLNYNKHCCFFVIPSNYHNPTFSSGIPSSRNNKPNPKIHNPDMEVNVQDLKYSLLVNKLMK
jgi:hypothetical protein